ncbi:MAG: hypothetical protein ABIP71_05120, partial [Verrucomicrobiota bacterium]
MKSKWPIFLVLLNVALLGVGFYLMNRLSSNLAPSGNTSAKVDLRNHPKLAKAKNAPKPQVAAPVEKIVYVTNQFH